MAKSTAISSKRFSPGKRTARLAETAFRKLQEAILSGKLREGEAVRESRLARQWEIGRTPLREAVRRAAESGYIVLRPNRAPLVRMLTASDLRHIYQLREVLECFALERAWRTLPRTAVLRLGKIAAQADAYSGSRNRLRAQFLLDRELHQLWIIHSRNPWLASILERLLIYRPNLVGFLIDHVDLSEAAFHEHKEILKAIKQGRFRRSLELLARHIRRSGVVLATLLENPRS